MLHRSQTDEAYAGDEKPSDFVLVPAKDVRYLTTRMWLIFLSSQMFETLHIYLQQMLLKISSNSNFRIYHRLHSHAKPKNGNEVRKQQQKSIVSSVADTVRLDVHKDHVTSMGFKNDGYDYSQHMKVMGGGAFIGKDGGARPDVGNFIELPADALPSVGELDRRLEAVTISHNLMDDDLRAALFDEDDGEGAFEELLDDFITDVSNMNNKRKSLTIINIEMVE